MRAARVLPVSTPPATSVSCIGGLRPAQPWRRGCTGVAGRVAAGALACDAQMMGPADFGGKLSLVLKALSMNRARLAADLGVDKSLVGRWVSGAVTPSTHNLHRLTELVTAKRPGFVLLDWDRSLDELAGTLGVASPTPAAASAGGGFGDWLPPGMAQEIEVTSRQRGPAYTGFWRTTRPAPELPGRFLHEHVVMWLGENGMLLQKTSLSGYLLTGWAMPLRNQLFSMLALEPAGMIVFGVYNGVPRQKAQVIDGLTMSVLPDAGGSPVATACLLERVADLSDDDAENQARFEAYAKLPPLAPEGSVPPRVAKHLYGDSGPTAAAQGGDSVLLLHFARSMTRAQALAGQPGAEDPAQPAPPPSSAAVLRPDFRRPSGASPV